MYRFCAHAYLLRKYEKYHNQNQQLKKLWASFRCLFRLAAFALPRRYQSFFEAELILKNSTLETRLTLYRRLRSRLRLKNKNYTRSSSIMFNIQTTFPPHGEMKTFIVLREVDLLLLSLEFMNVSLARADLLVRNLHYFAIHSTLVMLHQYEYIYLMLTSGFCRYLGVCFFYDNTKICNSWCDAWAVEGYGLVITKLMKKVSSCYKRCDNLL